MTVPPDDTTTDLHAVIAALRAERDAALSEKVTLAEELAARDATLVQRNTEYSERIQHQVATIDVLKAMSASPGDPQPVFDLIVRRAQELCNSKAAGVFEYDGELVDIRSTYRSGGDEIGYANYSAAFPMKPTRGLISSRAILDKRIVHIRDMSAEPELLPALRNLGVKSVLAVPLLRNDNAVGAFVINSEVPGGFTESQVALLQTFAEQAVIAISSAETYRALQTRTSDLQETLEYQTATSDILNVISRSTFDLEPVLETVVETAARLCDADQAVIGRREGDKWKLDANFGFPPEYEAYYRERGLFSYAPDTPSSGARVAREGRIVHIDDVAAVPGYPEASIRLGKQRTSLGVPLLRDGEVIGTIILARQRVEPFTDRQIELVSTFADQAVIAIENTRLITEQREALEQQTATAEVLQVINASPGNLTPVFDAMLERAMRLCGIAFGMMTTFDSERFHPVCWRGLPTALSKYFAEGGGPSGSSGMHAQLVGGAPLVYVADMKDEEAYRSGYPARRALVDLGGARTGLAIALRKEGVLLGTFMLYCQEVRSFSDKQIALLQNFAAQAVIAMENARLLTETREGLEQQTATAEVLQVINTSPGDLTPVFDAMLEKALRLCDAAFGNLWTYDGEVGRLAAICGASPEYRAELMRAGPQKPDPGSSLKRLVEGEPLIHIADITAEGAHRSGAALRRMLADRAGARTVLWVPLHKDGALLGFFTIYRTEVRPFTNKQITLLQNFAEQAVIAMENARLLTEQREALERQTATAEVLQAINGNPGDLTPVFDAILEKAHNLIGAAIGALVLYEGPQFRAVATHGFSEQHNAMVRQFHGPTPGHMELLAGARFKHYHDLRSIENDQHDVVTRSHVENNNARTALWVPLRKDDRLLGLISVYRLDVRPFVEKEISLLENFAAQAVIAMENARLITEQREALEQQTATAEVLQVINASPGNLTPVFDAILDKAHTLCGAVIGSLVLFDGTYFRAVATHGWPASIMALIREPTGPNRARQSLLDGERFVQVADLRAIGHENSAWRDALVESTDARTMLLVPLRKDAALLGFISAFRLEVRLFSGKEIALLENFAAQAVVAMENARLINEQREALEQQTATAEVLQVINASPGNLTPVFDAMLEKAMRLCGAACGGLFTYDGERFHTMATLGVPVAAAEFRTKYPPTAQPGSGIARLLRTRRTDQILDRRAEEDYWSAEPGARAMVELGGARTMLNVPLLKEDEVVGFFSVYRQEVRAFSEKQIALLENFAAQAVIAMENARLLDEIRQRQEELRVTFENMGDGVAMFDETQHLVAWNRKFQDILDVPDDIIERRQTFPEYVHYLAERGEYDRGYDPEEHVRQLIEQAGQPRTYERVRPDGRVIEVRHNPVAGGGFVLIFSDITERKRSEAEIHAARDAAQQASRTIEAAYRELKTAQANLIQAEKMASLGQLTAGIAHEIKNPLNFVNNFAALSVDLLSELKETAAPGFAALTEKQRAEVEEVSVMLTSNLEKITEHGKRADGIVKAMLEHSRGSSGERRMVDLNGLIDEALNLAYHGARAQDQSFNITLERDFGEGIASVEVNPQDITRVFLNLFANGFYATTRRARESGDARFVPTLRVTTIDAGDAVEIRVRDNGIGIPGDIRDKLFQPFFTTKPTGEGTGLGLSITYDIVTQQHGGTIAVDSEVGEYSEFTVRLPRNP